MISAEFLNHVKNIHWDSISHWINGQPRTSHSNEKQIVYSPYTGQAIGAVSLGELLDVDQAVRAAAQSFKSWSKTTFKERAQLLYRFKELLKQDLNKLSDIIAIESGKTPAEAQAGLIKGIEVIDFACSAPNFFNHRHDVVSKGVTCYETHYPLGVVASITPANFPGMVPLWTIPSALVTGNTLILKPSEQVPYTAMHLAKLLKQAGIPDGVFNVVNGSVKAVQAICEHPNIEAISFVGSSAIAERIHKQASSAGKRVLALGGAKNHIILMPDANKDFAPTNIVDSAIGCAGQRCMAATVVLAVGDCDHHIQAIQDYMQTLKPAQHLGAILNKKSLDRLHDAINQATEKEKDLRLLVDGRNPQIANFEQGYWFGPTLIDHTHAKMTIAQQELFGPILTIQRLPNLEAAIKVQNENEYGNGASIFTDSGPVADYATQQLSAGMVGVNIGIPVPREPFAFGGWKRSKFGYGDITGNSALTFWTKTKKITTKWMKPEETTWLN